MDFHSHSHPPSDLMNLVNESKYTKHRPVVLKIKLTVSVVSQPKCAICYGCSMPILTVFNCFCYRIPLAPRLFAKHSYPRRPGQCNAAHSRDEIQLDQQQWRASQPASQPANWSTHWGFIGSNSFVPVPRKIWFGTPNE